MKPIHNKQLILNERQIRTRYQHEKWYISLLLVFVSAGFILHITEPKIISPVPDTMTVYASDSKTQLQEIIDYIVNKFQPEGARVVTEALSCFISESHLDPKAYHYNSNGTWDYGIAQWNQVHGQTIDQLQDWKTQIDLAYSLYKRSGWNPWYGSGCGR